MAHAQFVGNEPFDAHRRDETGEVLQRAPEDFVTVAIRVAEVHQLLDLAQLGLGRGTTGHLHIGLLQLADRLFQRRLAGHFPAAGTEAVLDVLLHQDAVVALVHLQVQVRVVIRADDHHAQHLACVVAPLRQVAG
ncbi:hypothetical protein D3C72_1563540 [compost metagenome]